MLGCGCGNLDRVSIQLVSPTSGEVLFDKKKRLNLLKRFHSISFPNEWGGLHLLNTHGAEVAA
jgi:ABC-type oligopeptide transport system ATPase subunit